MNTFHILLVVLFCLFVPTLVWVLLRVQRRAHSDEDGAEDPVDVALASADDPSLLLSHCEGMNRISRSIESWTLQRRYTDPMLTLGAALSEMEVTGQELTLYLQMVHNIPGYRQWIAQLRVEEAKRLMIENPTYTFDAIARLCGMSNGSALARAFKAQTGSTPTDWLARRQQE